MNKTNNNNDNVIVAMYSTLCSKSDGEIVKKGRKEASQSRRHKNLKQFVISFGGVKI